MYQTVFHLGFFPTFFSCINHMLWKINIPEFITLTACLRLHWPQFVFIYKFTANNCETILQTARSVWQILCSQPYGRSSLGPCMFFFQAPVLWLASTVFRVSCSCVKTYQALAGEKLASLYGLLCRGGNMLAICKWDEMSRFWRHAGGSICLPHDTAEAERGRVLAKCW